MSRSTFSYAYVAAVALIVAAIVWISLPYDSAHQDNVVEVSYLAIAAIALNRTAVRLDRGHLTLLGLPIGAAAILLNPIHAAIVGLASSIGLRDRGRWPIIANGVIYAAIVALGSGVSVRLGAGSPSGFAARIAVLVAVNAAIFVFVTAGLVIRTGESVASIARHNFTIAFFTAFGYQTLAALLASYVLNGSLLGYALATIVFVLALALTDTIAGRRIRRVLESELTDADRHLFHSRAVEGVVHNLRNHIASAVGYLKEIDLADSIPSIEKHSKPRRRLPTMP